MESGQLKVLVITYYWPPSGGPGVQRWLKFSKYLPQHEIFPVVVTVDEKKASYPVLDKTLENEVHPAIEVHRTGSFEPLKLFSSLFKNEKIPYGGIPDRKKMSWIGKLSLYLRANYFIPDARKGWNKYALKKCENLIKSHGINVIVTTSPPHSTQLIGLELKKKHNIKWVADLRDPWTDIYYYKDLPHTNKSKQRDKDYETDVLKHADVITVTSEITRELFASKIMDADKIKVITNGYDESDLDDMAPITPVHEFVITFIGTINPTFGIGAFLKSVSSLLKDGKKLKLRFVGNVEPGLKTEIQNMLGSAVEFTGYVPHKKSIAYAKVSNLLLLIVPPGLNQATVPGKTFEYLSTRNPIICLAPAGSSVGKILEECNAGTCFEHNNREEIYSYINRLAEKWNNHIPIQINNSNFSKYSRKNLAAQMAAIIKELK
jgi:glycosyltransferase involved in cell wall biosynthesis